MYAGKYLNVHFRYLSQEGIQLVSFVFFLLTVLASRHFSTCHPTDLPIYLPSTHAVLLRFASSQDAG